LVKTTPFGPSEERAWFLEKAATQMEGRGPRTIPNTTPFLEGKKQKSCRGGRSGKGDSEKKKGVDVGGLRRKGRS